MEFELVREHIEEIDELVQKGQKELNWNSEGITNLLKKKKKTHCSIM